MSEAADGVDLEETLRRDPRALRFPLKRYPGMNPFVLDWLDGDAKATAFLPRRAVRDLRPRGVPPPGAALAPALIESNRRWGSFVADEVRQWAEGNSVAIVAGQQVGFGGGPLYTIAKIATLIRLKRDLQKAGVPATIFFWLATEDHDYEEAATLHIPLQLIARGKPGVNRQLDLLTLRATRAVDSKAVVGPAVIPEALIAQLLSLTDMERPVWLRDGVTFRDSFAELIAQAVDERIVFIDALLPELRRAGAPLFGRMANLAGSIQNEIAQRSAKLEEAGYTPQVTPRPDGKYTLLFRIDGEGERHIIEGGDASQDPETISTSALTRPLLQDFLLAPDLFVGGPAEVAYYAQIAPLHELLGVRQPAVALRGHALVAPQRVTRKLAQHAIEPHDVFSNADALLAEKEPDAVQEIRRISARARHQLSEELVRIGELALPAEHALARAITRSIGHIEYHFGKLTERSIRGLVRKERERWTAVREVVATFFPDGRVQDRVVAWLPWWQRYGSYFIQRLIEDIEPDSRDCRIVSL